MKATVKIANRKRGMFGAEIEGRGEFVVFELLDADVPEVGDVIAHDDFYSMGSETFTNVTQQCQINVYVQNVCGPSLVKKQCFLQP